MQTALPQPVLPPKDARGHAPHHLAFVDALRGYAILAVVMFHAGGKVAAKPGWLTSFTECGMYGVQLFFVISAFTLFWSLRTRSIRDRKPFRAFFVRRIFRLAPLFWTGIVFYLWQPGHWRTVYAPNGIAWPHIVATFLFVHGWYPTTIDSVVPGGWSIGAEAMFYLCVPLLFTRIRSLHFALWLFLFASMIASAGPAAARIIAGHFPPTWANLINLFVYYSFPSQLPVFCLGLILYFLLVSKIEHSDPFAGIGKGSRATLLLCAGAFFMLIGIPAHLQFSIAFVLIACGLAIRTMKLLVNQASRFVGKVSYSVYLWHFWILDRISPHAMVWADRFGSGSANGTFHFAVIFFAAMSLSTAVAAGSYYLIEEPGQRLGKRVIEALDWGSAQ